MSPRKRVFRLFLSSFFDTLMIIVTTVSGAYAIFARDHWFGYIFIGMGAFITFLSIFLLKLANFRLCFLAEKLVEKHQKLVRLIPKGPKDGPNKDT